MRRIKIFAQAEYIDIMVSEVMEFLASVVESGSM